MSKATKKKQPRTAAKILITLLCLIVLAVLGLSIAANVQLYDKVTDLTAALATADKQPSEEPPAVEPPVEEPIEQFKPIDSSTPVSLRAGSAGQHLYINTDETVLKAEAKVGAGLIAVKKPFSDTPSNTSELFTPDFAFMVMIEGDNAIKIMFANENRAILYDFDTEEFGYKYEDVTLITVADNGEIFIADSVLDYFEIDTVYLYPLAEIITDDFEGDMTDFILTIEVLNKLFAFSPFETKQ